MRVLGLHVPRRSAARLLLRSSSSSGGAAFLRVPAAPSVRGPPSAARGRAVSGAAQATSTEQPARGSFGSRFVERAREVESRYSEIRSARSSGSSRPGEGQTGGEADHSEEGREAATRLQLKQLFKWLTPSHVGLVTGYAMHKRGALQPKVKPPLDEDAFERVYKEARAIYEEEFRRTVRRWRRKKKSYMQHNTGYHEEEEVYEAEAKEFTEAWRQMSIAEDCWKAEYYQHLHHKAYEDIPEREPLASRGRTDRVADVAAGAFRAHLIEQNRPVLTHELADYENPYMMKRSALERLLHERCVRNQLDERCMPRLLERQPDLVKLRAKAALPPEVFEPLAAFRGDTQWHFDMRERLSQKLSAANSVLEAVVESKGDADAVAAAMPENAGARADQVPGLHHPWENHVGFETAVPQGVGGGNNFGQPMRPLEAQILRLRYPTLQRVAHTLPADSKWRAHVVRTIRVLERSRNWDYQSKLFAVNRLKEIYDSFKPSAEYMAKLDEKLPLNRVPSHLKRKYARHADYVKTYPRKYKIKKSMTRYRSSLTALTPLKKSK